jgi:hypothetical protein
MGTPALKRSREILAGVVGVLSDGAGTCSKRGRLRGEFARTALPASCR